jgi:ribosomal protein S18 acetylase RimI-like enzyme
MKQELTLRKCSLAMLQELREISKITFADTYADQNEPKVFKEYLGQAFSESKLKLELANPQSEFYFYYYESKLAGYVKVNFSAAQTDVNDNKSLKIERIYVLKHMQGKGVGLTLLNHSIKIAQENSLTYIWLGVWKKNPKAISFYDHQGFHQFDTHSFYIGDDLQDDALMKLPINYPAI